MPDKPNVNRLPTVTVAIPTYGREDVLVDTIRRVLELKPPPDAVIVVDQTERHETTTQSALDAAVAAGQILLVSQERPNLPAARNRALRSADTEVVIFVDDDVVPDPDFVSAHAANYLDPRIVGVAGRTIQRLGWSTPHRSRPWPMEDDFRFFRLDGTTRVEPIANFVGCNHSVRRAAMLAVGGYDENYSGWAYREDTDAALRLWKAGGRIAFDPGASLYHLASPAGGCRVSSSRRTPSGLMALPASYFAFRHEIHRWQGWRDILFFNVRRYVLRRDVVLRPWRLPWTFATYLYALASAFRLAVNRWRAPTNTKTQGLVSVPRRERMLPR